MRVRPDPRCLRSPTRRTCWSAKPASDPPRPSERAAPEAGSSPPAGSAIFQFGPSAGLVTEAGVGAIRSTKAARIYVDHIGAKTGVAVVNRGDLSTDVTFTLMNRYGVVEGSASGPFRQGLIRLDSSMNCFRRPWPRDTAG